MPEEGSSGERPSVDGSSGGQETSHGTGCPELVSFALVERTVSMQYSSKSVVHYHCLSCFYTSAVTFDITVC